MARLRTFWLDLLDSLWFVPGLLTLAGAAFAILLVNVNDAVLAGLDPDLLWWAFGGTADGAAGVLGAIASGIITVTGVVFSITIVALQLASVQFTPRVLRQFTADRANQVVLGVFIGTFTYTLLVQRTLRTGNGEEFVPNIAVTGAVILALVSIAFLIFFINHAARSIQAAVIIDSITRDTLDVIRHIFPERLERGLGGVRQPPAQVRGESRVIDVRRAGYIQSLDTHALHRVARTRGVTVCMDVEIGRYVLPGDPVMSVWPAAGVDDGVERELRDALVLGMERTTHQDLKLGIIELMDIAVKAMSPSVNDPTTALNAIDRMGEILLELAWRRRGDAIDTADGRPLLIVRRPELDETVGIAFDQVRHYAAQNPTVAVAMIRLLGRLADLAPHERDVFAKHLREVVTAAEQRITDPVDRLRVDAATREAIRLAAGAEPRRGQRAV